MLKTLISLASCILITSLHADFSKATALWVPEAQKLLADQALRTVIVIKIDNGWHTYWENPGEGGLSLSINADLPDGWKIGKIQHPAPIRFMTGELAGYGYEGTVHFPITITPPQNFEGKIPTLKAKLTWLTCNDSACIPGNAEMTLSEKIEPDLISKSYNALPQEIANAQLFLKETESSIILNLTLPTDTGITPSEYKLYPATLETLDHATDSHFKKDPSTENAWTSTWPKNEYYKTIPEKFTLVLNHKNKPSLKISTK